MTIPAQWAYVIGGAIFGTASAWTAMRLGLAKEREDRERENGANHKDLKGIGDLARGIDRKAERRWRYDIASDIDELEPKDKAARIAKRLRQG